MTTSSGIPLADFVETQVIKARAAEMLAISPATLQYFLNDHSAEEILVMKIDGAWHYRTISPWLRGNKV